MFTELCVCILFWNVIPHYLRCFIFSLKAFPWYSHESYLTLWSLCLKTLMICFSLSPSLFLSRSHTHCISLSLFQPYFKLFQSLSWPFLSSSTNICFLFVSAWHPFYVILISYLLTLLSFAAAMLILLSSLKVASLTLALALSHSLSSSCNIILFLFLSLALSLTYDMCSSISLFSFSLSSSQSSSLSHSFILSISLTHHVLFSPQ